MEFTQEELIWRGKSEDFVVLATVNKWQNVLSVGGLAFINYVRTRAFASVAWGRPRQGLCQGFFQEPIEILN